ncbi:hypothetical protein Dtox_2483 [Desulfofarcimen acetoxidans DSM 771]|uniref:Uncharacterized protein n=1 Tax=Desulfofarcimen acetoxidans (strain ATCC 49208 / DSM 771 / KCTC 5769 / VKM B-1644 / 5575) TaxID=485916 RepID=C8W0N5_DESAS|nr:hypothetical protein [Desulfofarcimen acetoxidans]ACV63290.1 hypothetical protein Dtox_2483 [Desulfofarcimen acetoxidans DSM 771]
MKKMRKRIKAFLREEKGGIAENTAIVVMILIIVVGVVAAVSVSVKGAQTQASSKLTSAQSSTY